MSRGDEESDHTRIRRLCDAVAWNLSQSSRRDALVICWLELVHADRRTYGDDATATRLRECDGDWLPPLKLHAANRALPADVIFEAVKGAPMRLLRLCDALTMQSEPADESEESEPVVEGAETEPFHLSVTRVVVDDRIANWLSKPADMACVFLCRRKPTHFVAAFEPKTSNPELFHPNWLIVPEIPDQNQGTLKVRLESASGLFSRLCEGLARKKQLKVYLAEFKTVPVFDSEWAGDGKTRSWKANGLSNEDAIIADVDSHLHRASDLGADVVVFPELTVPPRIRTAISDWLSARVEWNEATSAVQWVIAGSFHTSHGEHTERKTRNQAWVLDGLGGRVELLNQIKINPVEFTGKLQVLEAINPGTEIYLAYTALGIQSVAICADLADDTPYKKLPLDLLPLSILWVPSLSDSRNAHLRRAEYLARNCDVVIACVNQGEAEFDPGIPLGGKSQLSFVYANVADRKAAQLAPMASLHDWKLFNLYDRKELVPKARKKLVPRSEKL